MHKTLKTREAQLHNILCKIHSEFGHNADVEKLKRVPKELYTELDEWFTYWHRKLSDKR